MSRVPRGRLVVFEGGEGAGKTTQLRRLASALAAAGVPHRLYREPGGTTLGDRVRDLLLHADAPVSPRAEAALFIASRAQLVAQELIPALDRGEHVLLDRFLLSTYAYQVHGRGLPLDEVRAANHLATAGLVPDLTLLLDLNPVDGLKRVLKRGATPDRIEQADGDFHWRVAEAFRAFADPAWQAEHPECGPIVAVDASGREDEVQARLRSVLAERLPALSPSAAGAR